MQGHHRPIYAQRLNKDIAELFNHNFDCSASTLTVKQTADSWNVPGSIVLVVSIVQGPYRGGVFSFNFDIPENYPFKSVSVWACHSIWHPNVQLTTGKVALPLEWSPVITLRSVAMAVQMLMLEPSCDNPLNLEAYSHYMSSTEAFDALVQKYLRDSQQSHRLLNAASSGVNFCSSSCSSSSSAIPYGLPSVNPNTFTTTSSVGLVSSPRKRAFRDIDLEEQQQQGQHHIAYSEEGSSLYYDNGAIDDSCSVAMSVNSQPTSNAAMPPATASGYRSMSHSPINSEMMYKMSISPEDCSSSNVTASTSGGSEAYKRRKI